MSRIPSNSSNPKMMTVVLFHTRRSPCIYTACIANLPWTQSWIQPCRLQWEPLRTIHPSGRGRQRGTGSWQHQFLHVYNGRGQNIDSLYPLIFVELSSLQWILWNLYTAYCFVNKLYYVPQQSTWLSDTDIAKCTWSKHEGSIACKVIYQK